MSGERVNESDACWSVVSAIAGHYDETKNECRGGNLLVERILGMGDSQPSPDLCGLLVEWQDRIGVVANDSVQPAFQARGLGACPRDAGSSLRLGATRRR